MKKKSIPNIPAFVFYAPDNTAVHQFEDVSPDPERYSPYNWMPEGWRVQLDYTPNGGGSIKTFHTALVNK